MNDRSKNESVNTRFGKGVCSALALVYTGLLTFFFYDHYYKANRVISSEDPENFGFYCIDETVEVGPEAENYAAPYLYYMKVNFLILLGLTIGSILTITASFLPFCRCCNCLVWTFGNVAHLVGLLMITMFRFSEDAEMCVSE